MLEFWMIELEGWFQDIGINNKGNDYTHCWLFMYPPLNAKPCE